MGIAAFLLHGASKEIFPERHSENQEPSSIYISPQQDQKAYMAVVKGIFDRLSQDVQIKEAIENLTPGEVGSYQLSETETGVYRVDKYLIVKGITPQKRAEMQSFWRKNRNIAILTGILSSAIYIYLAIMTFAVTLTITPLISVLGIVIVISTVFFAAVSFGHALEAHFQIKQWGIDRAKNDAIELRDKRAEAYKKGFFFARDLEISTMAEDVKIPQKEILDSAEIDNLYILSLSQQKAIFDKAIEAPYSNKMDILMNLLERGLFDEKSITVGRRINNLVGYRMECLREMCIFINRLSNEKNTMFSNMYEENKKLLDKRKEFYIHCCTDCYEKQKRPIQSWETTELAELTGIKSRIMELIENWAQKTQDGLSFRKKYNHDRLNSKLSSIFAQIIQIFEILPRYYLDPKKIEKDFLENTQKIGQEAKQIEQIKIENEIITHITREGFYSGWKYVLSGDFINAFFDAVVNQQ